MEVFYFLWLIPGKDSFDDYQNLIDRIADKMKSVSFPPHITLIAGMQGDEEQMVEKSEELIEGLKSFDISLGDFGSKGEFFKMFYLLVDDSEKVIDLNKKGSEIFGITKDYMPHVSLLYKDQMSDEERGLIEKMVPSDLMQVFKADEIWLCKGTVEVDSWEIVKRYELI